MTWLVVLVSGVEPVLLTGLLKIHRFTKKSGWNSWWVWMWGMTNPLGMVMHRITRERSTIFRWVNPLCRLGHLKNSKLLYKWPEGNRGYSEQGIHQAVCGGTIGTVICHWATEMNMMADWDCEDHFESNTDRGMWLDDLLICGFTPCMHTCRVQNCAMFSPFVGDDHQSIFMGI